MNQDNYCSLEVAQRLVDAGIVLETECFYDLKSELHLNRGMTGKRLVREGCLPAPCFAELWRELPQSADNMLSTLRKFYGDNISLTFLFRRLFDIAHNIDFAITLLIWVTEQRKEKV